MCVGCCCCCLFGWVGFWFLSLGKFVFNHKHTPVVDRPSLALVRQCREKKDLPLIFPEHEDLIMDNARQAAAAGFIRSESIPLLALTDESFYHGKLSWTLRFPVPPPDTSGSARRFSSTVTFQQGPHSAFDLQTPFPIPMRPLMFFSTPLFCVSLISLYSALRVLNLMKLLHPRNPRYKTGLTIVRLVSSLPVTVHIPVPLGLVDYFNSNIHLPQVSMLIATHQCHNEDATAEARKHKRDFSPTAFLRIIPADTVMSGNRLPDIPSPVLHLRLYHVLPSPHLLPSSLPDLSNRPQGQRNHPTRRRLRPLVHNTPLLQVLALTPNDPAYPAKAAPPQVDPLDTCPFFCLMAAWLNEVVVRAVALLSALAANKRIHDAYYSVVKWQLYKPSINTEYDQQSPRECRYLYWRV